MKKTIFFCYIMCCVIQKKIVSLQKITNDMNQDSALIILQTICLTTEVCMAAMLGLARIHTTRYDSNYETARWLLFTAALLGATHYWMQMHFGFRAQGDDVGAVINILFYTPTAYIISYVTTKMACGRRRRQRYVMVAIVSMVLIVATFIAGWFIYHSLHMEYALYTMAVIFFLTMIYFIFYPFSEIQRVRKQIEDETADDIHNYNMYMRVGTIMTFSLAAMIPITIFSTTVLMIFGPLFMLAMFFYMVSFIALGFNMHSISDIINVPEEEDEREPDRMAPELAEEIENKIQKWIATRGFSNPDVNLSSMAMVMAIDKKLLTQFFAEQKGQTFRMWLSDLRINEVKRMLLNHQEYTHEGIAMECGYSSRSWMQQRFKAVTGMTPAEWKRKQSRREI